MEYIVYLVKNLSKLNMYGCEMLYVGWTGTSFKDRWERHLGCAFEDKEEWHFSRALRKYGPKAFAHEVLAIVKTKKEAAELEKLWIRIFCSYNPKYGYNMTMGGEGGSYKGKPSSLKGKTYVDIYGEEKAREQRLKHSRILIGHQSKKNGKTDLEFYGFEKAEAISKKLSEKAVQRESRLCWITDGTTTRKVDREGLILQSGWCIGRTVARRIWITNGVINRRPLKEDVIPEGFHVGRVKRSNAPPIPENDFVVA